MEGGRRRHATQGGYLVLTVTPDQQERAVWVLIALGAIEAHGDRLVIEALHAEETPKGIDWDRAILWVLIPAADPRGCAESGRTSRAVTASTEHLALPEVWLKNLHRTLAA